MAVVNFVLQGKGGVGKSLISALIAQYTTEKGTPLMCIDTDPVNATFAQYSAFDVERLEIMDGTKINERNFDSLMEKILTDETEDLQIIIDNGASSFVPLSSYLVENGAIEMLADMGHEVIIHTVITGGQALLDTLQGFSSLATQFSDKAKLVVWLNEFFGPIQQDGKSFESMKVYKDNKARIAGLLTIKQQNQDTFGKDMEEMLNGKLTFDQAIESSDFQLMAKQRLKMMKKDLLGQMAVALV
jgi:hypothetical protein